MIKLYTSPTYDISQLQRMEFHTVITAIHWARYAEPYAIKWAWIVIR
jgi:hypothetical protein